MPSLSLASHVSKAPLHNILEAVTTSILKTQEKLNRDSLEIANRLAGTNPEDQVRFGADKYSLLELGFVPEFYRLGETQVKLKMSMQLERNQQQSAVYASLLNEQNLGGFGFSTDAASEITATLVPVSAPNVFEKRIANRVSELNAQAFTLVRQYAIDKNASSMTFKELEATGINELIEQNMTEYKARLVTLHPDQLPNIPALQQVITEVNGLVKIKLYVTKKDTRPMTLDELYATGVQGAVEQNLLHYRNRLSEITVLNDIAGLQAVVQQANSFAQILGLLQLNQLASLSTQLFNASGLLRIDESRWQLYIQAMEKLDQKAIGTFTRVSLQLLIDKKNT